MPERPLTIREAVAADIPQLVELVRTVHEEVDTELAFVENHAWEHMTYNVCNGVSYVAEAHGQIVGLIAAAFIDVAFAQTENLETLHWYIAPNARSTKAGSLLLDALEQHADQNGIVVIFHQADYHSALNGKRNNSRAVERIYRSRGYEGPLDVATVGHGGRRVGVSYRYPARQEDASQSIS
ncbi:N-acetyltransferase family protein [Roseobacteraceae bacterium S113]